MHVRVYVFSRKVLANKGRRYKNEFRLEYPLR